MRVIKPPEPFDEFIGQMASIFLAGSIDMGAAVDWQSEVTAVLSDLDILVLNPRRDDWDSTWEQSRLNPNFQQQVEWELEGLERARLIALYLAPSSKAPISLMELGLHARSGKLLVGCPSDFYRYGNIDITCGKYGIPLLPSLDTLIAAARSRLQQLIR